MKIDAVGVTSSDIEKTVKFYTLLGFEFTKVNPDHTEPETPDGSARLMIDSVSMVTSIIGESPKPANHSPFAINYDSAEEVNEIAKKVEEAGFTVVKKPWDAPWGQRYCIVQDPDGYKVDLYANL